ncbi:hypothetical protein Salat_2619500 [Sesamum alatum]|uniref:Uncharacterized protein n=1 Tax=Sesamum alatum TaxID=300844 RepID=A0AAE1XPH3_9LAMI|nr:hypothetical protein Salat_2619500 [Sesamum alatum]
MRVLLPPLLRPLNLWGLMRRLICKLIGLSLLQRGEVCYRRLARVRGEISKASDLNVALSANAHARAPNWQVSDESSIFSSLLGETSFELYQACLLPRDVQALSDFHNVRLEMMVEKEKAYASGKFDHLNSPEYATVLKEACMNGAWDFMGYRAFKAAVMNQSTEDGLLNFYKCLDQLKHLKGIKEDFDMTQLSFFKDSKCKKYKKFCLVGPGWKDDEFVELANPLKNTSLDGLESEDSKLDNSDDDPEGAVESQDASNADGPTGPNV